MSLRTVMSAPSRRPRATLVAAIGLAAVAGAHAHPLAAQQGGQPIDLGSMSEEGMQDISSAGERPLQITGFGVADYGYSQRTGDNSAQAAKVAVALFRELSDKVWMFGQLTTALATEGAEDLGPGEEVPTEIEIDNLLINFTPGGGSGLSLSVGKFDLPLGFERDDEPLNLQATNSFNFELARPVKLVGAVGRWSVNPKLDVAAMVGNGWDAQVDENHAKTVGLRLGALPTEHSSFGVGGLFGPEGEQGETHDRWLLTGDYAIQPSRNWIIAGEANYGGEQDFVAEGESASWYGGTLTLFHRMSESFGTTLRGEVFRDPDGARTGDAQTLQSITFAPVYFIGSGREGIFANVEHTTFRIPRFQVRAEARLDHSSIDAFATSDGESDWQMNYVLQLVATF